MTPTRIDILGAGNKTVRELPAPQGLRALPSRAETDTRVPARRNEMVVRIRGAAQMRGFLDRATALGARVLGSIPELNAVRLGFDQGEQADQVRALLMPYAASGLNFLVTLPSPPPNPGNSESDRPYLAFGNQALPWLGVPENNSTRGSGVTVALLDTGILPVPGLSTGSISQLDLVEQGATTADAQYHGTAIASIIASTSSQAPGIAPAAHLLSIRVMDSNGVSDTFTVAQAIITAVNNGAQIISMSLGSYGNDFVLNDAINYALSRNVAIVAAAGNDGSNSVAYPAAYPGVIAVTAVDANSRRASFANYGPQVALAAPGIGIYTPLYADELLSISGTSAAVPFVAGALAGLLSQYPGMSTAAAAQLLAQYANDAGAPGPDPMYGSGILSIDRILNRNTPGISDAALADLNYTPPAYPSGVGTITVTAQNRGTTWLPDVQLAVTSANGQSIFNLGPLQIGAVKAQSITIDPARLKITDGATLQARVFINSATDAKPSNDTKTVVLRLRTAAAP